MQWKWNSVGVQIAVSWGNSSMTRIYIYMLINDDIDDLNEFNGD